MQSRWKAVLTYRSEVGPVDIEHDIEELGEIEGLVEAGPDWNTLIEGRFTLNRRSEPESYTVEAAEKQSA